MEIVRRQRARERARMRLALTVAVAAVVVASVAVVMPWVRRAALPRPGPSTLASPTAPLPSPPPSSTIPSPPSGPPSTESPLAEPPPTAVPPSNERPGSPDSPAPPREPRDGVASARGRVPSALPRGAARGVPRGVPTIGNIGLRINHDPSVPEAQEYLVAITDSAGRPLTDATVTLRGRRPDGTLAEAALEASSTPGHYGAWLRFPSDAPQELALRISRGGRTILIPVAELERRSPR